MAWIGVGVGVGAVIAAAMLTVAFCVSRAIGAWTGTCLDWW